MEFGLSHVVIAVIAFAVGCLVRRKHQSPATATAPGPAVGTQTSPDGDAIGLPPLRERIFKIVFTGAWLVAWTTGLLVAGVSFLTTLSAPSFASVFLGAWIVGATAVWIFVGTQWVRMLRGHPDAFAREGKSR